MKNKQNTLLENKIYLHILLRSDTREGLKKHSTLKKNHHINMEKRNVVVKNPVPMSDLSSTC